ncbi:GTP-binding protein [Bryobacterales bacterium F-183]|nr:GTP-binding protein [Bryobacterales bacterium F-183]
MLHFKVCLIGSFGVGKTSLVKRFVSSIYDDRYLTTVGVRVDRRELHARGHEVTLVLWDLAGEDNFTSLSMKHLRGMSGYMLVVDGTRQDSFLTALRLQGEVAAAHPDARFVLLANKSDLREDWEISPEDLDRLEKQGWSAHATSAKTGDGVEAAFQHLADNLVEAAASAVQTA